MCKPYLVAWLIGYVFLLAAQAATAIDPNKPSPSKSEEAYKTDIDRRIELNRQKSHDDPKAMELYAKLLYKTSRANEAEKYYDRLKELKAKQWKLPDL